MNISTFKLAFVSECPKGHMKNRVKICPNLESKLKKMQFQKKYF